MDVHFNIHLSFGPRFIQGQLGSALNCSYVLFWL